MVGVRVVLTGAFAERALFSRALPGAQSLLAPGQPARWKATLGPLAMSAIEEVGTRTDGEGVL
jgi:hypothetical protein